MASNNSRDFGGTKGWERGGCFSLTHGPMLPHLHTESEAAAEGLQKELLINGGKHGGGKEDVKMKRPKMHEGACGGEIRTRTSRCDDKSYQKGSALSHSDNENSDGLTG